MQEGGDRAGRAPAEMAAALCRRLAGIVDPEQRARSLGGHLAAHGPETIAATLAEIIEAADRREPGAGLLVKAMIAPGLRIAWEERLAIQVVAHARSQGRYDLAGMFLDLPPMDERVAPPPPPLPKALAKVPLGVRRSLARRSDIGLIERLLADPDPAVVANLLNNPRVTEVEVVLMAARSPVREEVLTAIARHPRWGVRRRVRVALAHNPGTPTGVALGLLHLLLDQELREIAADPRLSQVIAARAAHLLQERRRGGGAMRALLPALCAWGAAAALFTAPARGQSPTGAPGAPFRAFGNEPGWRLVIEGGRMTLDADYGATTLGAAAPEPVPVPGGRAYAGEAGGRPLRVTVRDEICHDTMTGMPRPFMVRVEFDGRALDGCGGEPASLLRGAWLVERVDGVPALQDPKPTLAFGDDGSVSGNASCNSYSGSYALTGEGLTVSGLLSTMKACPPPLMQQEDTFLAVLREVMRFERPPDGALVLHAATGRTIGARRNE